jgi:ferrous iron transport protein B
MASPLYRIPNMKSLARNTSHKSFHYIKKAGPAIFIFSNFIWVGTEFPKATLHLEGKPEVTQLEQSYLGQVGKALEPIFLPMGVDWRVGVSLNVVAYVLSISVYQICLYNLLSVYLE